MRDNFYLIVAKACYKDRFLFLLILVVMLILLGPFVEHLIRLRFFMDLLFTFIFITTIYAASQKRKHVIIAVILCIPTIFALWAENFQASNYLITIGYLCGVILFAFAIIAILTYIFSEQTMTRQTISAAIAVYMLMALMWAFVYRLIESLYPASFAISNSKLEIGNHLYLYFSIVTLTTLGYGDITPVGRQVASLAALEAIAGQIYLVVVVAWFVGMYVSIKSRR